MALLSLSPAGFQPAFIFAVAASPFFLYGSNAFADTGDSLAATFNHTIQTDSNLFRLSDAVEATNVIGTSRRSDRVDVSSAAITLDQSYSLQRFRLSGSLINYDYHRFGNLSFTASNYSATWLWSLTSSIRGTISTDRSQSLNSFSDFRLYNTRNIRTEYTSRVEAEADVHTQIQLLTGLDSVRRVNEIAGVTDGDRKNQGATVGIQYRFPSNSTFAYRLRRGNGESNNGQYLGTGTAAIPNYFDEQRHEIVASWAFTKKTTIYGSLGYLSRKYYDFQQRDFNGPIADFNLQWDITGKTSVNAALKRNLSNYQDITSSYVSSDRVIVKPLWKATSKISVLGNFEYARRAFEGASVGTLSTSGRRDIYHQVSIGVEWRPVSAVIVALMLQRLQNTSNYFGYDYISTGGSMSARIVF